MKRFRSHLILKNTKVEEAMIMYENASLKLYSLENEGSSQTSLFLREAIETIPTEFKRSILIAFVELKLNMHIEKMYKTLLIEKKAHPRRTEISNYIGPIDLNWYDSQFSCSMCYRLVKSALANTSKIEAFLDDQFSNFTPSSRKSRRISVSFSKGNSII